MKLDIIDTHQHLWDLKRFGYSWCAGIPVLNRSFLPSDYATATAALPADVNIVQSVHLEADVDEPDMAGETEWILSLAETPGSRLTGVVGCCRPERAGFAAWIERFAGRKPFKGLRRVLHTQPDDLPRLPLFVENLRLLPRYNLTFDLCVQQTQLPLAAELARRCPDTQFVLDHCGNPDVKAGTLDPWRNHIRELAKLPNIAACKISGIVANADPASWTPDTLRPYIDHCLSSFGPDRVMFGSDWPVCTLAATFAQWVEAALALTSSLSPAERNKLLNANARRVYRL